MVEQHFEIGGTRVVFATRPDLFSPKGLDKGTQLLLESIVDKKYQQALDWGCGWGGMGLWLAAHNPSAAVTMLDSDMSAIKATQVNIESNKLQNITLVASTGFEDLPEHTDFDLIVSHPPTHRGREVVESMIRDSHQYLAQGGQLIIVVEARLKPWVKRSLEQVFGACKTLDHTQKHVVLSAVR